MTLTPEQVAERQAAALKSIEDVGTPAAPAPANGEAAKPGAPAKEGPTPSTLAPESPTSSSAAEDPLAAESLRKRYLAVCLRQTFDASDFHVDAREIIAELVTPCLDLDKDGKPVIRRGDELIELSAESLQEALGPAGQYLRRARGVPGSGGRAPRPASSSSRPAWMDSQEEFERKRKQLRAERKQGATE